MPSQFIEWLPLRAWMSVFGAVVVLACHAGQGFEETPSLPSSTGLTPAQMEAFTWFDGLDGPSLKGCRPVCVAWANPRPIVDAGPNVLHEIAFLLDANDTQFTVLTLSTNVMTYPTNPPEHPFYVRGKFQEVDLGKQAAAYLASLRADRARSWDDPLRNSWFLFQSGPHLSQGGEVFVLARACALAGLEPLARELLDLAEEVYRERQPADRPADSLRVSVARDLANKEMWAAVEGFGDLKVSRQELLERFERVIRQYPESEHLARAQKTVELLRVMVREDEEHASQLRPFDTMTKDEQVAELVFQLRNQNGHQVSQPGECNPFHDPRGHESPAEQLARIGFAAVPRLIDALGDHRFTRSVGFHRSFRFSHHVLRVSDCAQAVLEKIAGESFGTIHISSDGQSTEKQIHDATWVVRNWWERAQAKGEKQVLVEAVELAAADSLWQAGRLLEKYPDAALLAIITCARKTEGLHERAQMICLAGQIEGDAPVPFLCEQMRQGACLSWRVVAAEVLLARGQSEAVPAMIDEWRRLAARSGRERHDKNGWHALKAFLAYSGSVEAINALAEGYRQRPVNERLSILWQFQPNEGGRGLELWMLDGVPYRIDRVRDDSGPAAAAIEHLLLAALDDTETTDQDYISDDFQFANPRMCDVAGDVLKRRWPDKYEFNLQGTVDERDQQRGEILHRQR